MSRHDRQIEGIRMKNVSGELVQTACDQQEKERKRFYVYSLLETISEETERS